MKISSLNFQRIVSKNFLRVWVLVSFSLTILAIQFAFAVPQNAVSVFVEKPKMQAIFNVLTYPARVESKVNAVVRSESDGVVDKILKPLGSQVRRGDIIAVVRHTDPVYQYAPLNVVAPVSGVVNDVQVTPGSLLNKGDAVVTLTDPKQLRIVIEVAAADLRSIKNGLFGELAVVQLEKPIKVEVQGVSPSIDPMLGTATCQLKLADTDLKKVAPGMLGKVQFKVNERQGYMVPDFAVVYNGEEAFLRVVENEKSKKIPVKLGEKRQGQIEILSGLKEGDVVINRASRFVSEGESVKVETSK